MAGRACCCGTGTTINVPDDVEVQILCDNNDGVITTFVRFYYVDIDTNTVTLVEDLDLTGAAYTPTGIVGACTIDDVETEILCDDTLGDGTVVVEFMRHYIYAEDGTTVTSQYDTELDGATGYFVLGTVGVCSTTTQDVEEEILCDIINTLDEVIVPFSTGDFANPQNVIVSNVGLANSTITVTGTEDFFFGLGNLITFFNQGAVDTNDISFTVPAGATNIRMNIERLQLAQNGRLNNFNVVPSVFSGGYDLVGSDVIANTDGTNEGILLFPDGTTFISFEAREDFASGGGFTISYDLAFNDTVQFIRHFVYSDDGLTVTSTYDTELDGTTPYTTLGDAQLCDLSTNTKDAEQQILCDVTAIEGAEGFAIVTSGSNPVIYIYQSGVEIPITSVQSVDSLAANSRMNATNFAYAVASENSATINIIDTNGNILFSPIVSHPLGSFRAIACDEVDNLYWTLFSRASTPATIVSISAIDATTGAVVHNDLTFTYDAVTHGTLRGFAIDSSGVGYIFGADGGNNLSMLQIDSLTAPTGTTFLGNMDTVGLAVDIASDGVNFIAKNTNLINKVGLDGVTISTTDINGATPYPNYTDAICGTGVVDAESSEVKFIRHYVYSEDGTTVTSTYDTELDGVTAYTVVGTVVVCSPSVSIATDPVNVNVTNTVAVEEVTGTNAIDIVRVAGAVGGTNVPLPAGVVELTVRVVNATTSTLTTASSVINLFDNDVYTFRAEEGHTLTGTFDVFVGNGDIILFQYTYK